MYKTAEEIIDELAALNLTWYKGYPHIGCLRTIIQGDDCCPLVALAISKGAAITPFPNTEASDGTFDALLDIDRATRIKIIYTADNLGFARQYDPGLRAYMKSKLTIKLRKVDGINAID